MEDSFQTAYACSSRKTSRVDTSSGTSLHYVIIAPQLLLVICGRKVAALRAQDLHIHHTSTHRNFSVLHTQCCQVADFVTRSGTPLAPETTSNKSSDIFAVTSASQY